MDIRRAAPADVPAILEIFRIAKAYMAAHGNAGQWCGDYPGLPELLPDIARGHSYVLTDGGVIVGTFSFIIGDEPTYRVLLNGHWHADRPHGMIVFMGVDADIVHDAEAEGKTGPGHAVGGSLGGQAVDGAVGPAITGYGFRKCGNIYASNGTLRTAYDFIRP